VSGDGGRGGGGQLWKWLWSLLSLFHRVLVTHLLHKRRGKEDSTTKPFINYIHVQWTTNRY
jgi:hypothetical protein